MLTNKVLEEVISPIAGMSAIVNITCPPLKVTTTQSVKSIIKVHIKDSMGHKDSPVGAYRWPSFSCRTQSAFLLKILGSLHLSHVQQNGCTSSWTCFVQSEGLVNFLD